MAYEDGPRNREAIMRAYSQDLRERVLQAYDAGDGGYVRSYVAAATHTNLSGAVGEANISLGFQGDRLYGLSRMLSLP